MKDFAGMSNEQIEEELLKLCIGERFVRDVEWLVRLYDQDHSEAKWNEIRAWLISANPHRHSSICPADAGWIHHP
jgi:hypothetical protein